MNSVIAAIATTVIGGLGIFLLGMKFMSDGLQVIAGDRLRKLIGMVTNNRFLAVGAGTLVTSIIQSSSITTVLVVGFVNSGLMTLRQAIGVILGSNIGTTMTAWILVIAIGKYGLPMIGIAVFIYLFAKGEKIQFSGMAIMGIGMVFFGLELMKNGFVPLRELPDFERWFHLFEANSYVGVMKCAGIGCLLTLIVQSSSATVGVTMGLASTGIIRFETAAALVLGENIGTTITALLASIGTSVNARRAAYAHSLFNVSGVIWITLIFGFYLSIIRKIIGVDPNTMVMADGVETYPHICAAIAMVHSGFNIANTALFVPFLPLYTKLMEKLVPEKPYVEKPHLTHLDVRMVETPMVAIEQSRKEVIVMCDRNRVMLDDLKMALSNGTSNQELVKSLFDGEEALDTMQKEITVFLTELLAGRIPPSLSDEAQDQVRIADEYESVSDYVTAILKLHLRISKAGLILSEPMRNDLFALHGLISGYYSLVGTVFVNNDASTIQHVHRQGGVITDRFREFRSRHLQRISETKHDPMMCNAYMDMLSDYRKIKDHLINIAEVVAGEK
ncbi:MAG: Na/Pi cotransporter family protein [Chitinispirillaceae bacterium]|nr:Na/Pi cotransporter family protein [Chitinispirillaceae bacterium]